MAVTASNVELSLIPKPKRAGGFKWQRRFGEHIGLEADPLRGFCFSLDFRAPRGVTGVYVGVLRLEVAIDIKLVDPPPYLLDATSIGVRVTLRVIDAERIDQMPVNQRVLGGHFGRRAAGYLASNLAGFENGYRQPGSGQQIGSCEADNSSPHNRDIGASRMLELRIGGRVCRRGPTALSFSGKLHSFHSGKARVPMHLDAASNAAICHGIRNSDAMAVNHVPALPTREEQKGHHEQG